MKEDEAKRLLTVLLESLGAQWTEESGFIRFRSRHEGMLWETACRPCPGAMLIYARFPVTPGEPEKAAPEPDEDFVTNKTDYDSAMTGGEADEAYLLY